MNDELKEIKDNVREQLEVLSRSIITDEVELRKPNELVGSVEEAADIAESLFATLTLRSKNNDVGLAAPQIGIHKKVCVVRAKESIVLVNPEIIETSGETWFQEGCLSFPGVSLKTKRHKDIVVKVDWLGEYNGLTINWIKDQTLYFSPNEMVPMEDDLDLLESVAVQHETDHTNSILFFDREWKSEQRINKNKVGRNNPCPCGSGLKYKKCCGKI